MRIQLVAGIVVGLVGLATAFLGPIAAWFAIGPSISDLSPDKLGGPLDQFMERAGHFGQWRTFLVFGGLVLSAAGFLYSFAVWADWFIGRRNAEPKPTSPA
jgi:hypothetical protein